MSMDKYRTISFQRSLPLRYEVDVFVAGGGPAGVAAALAASRQGARVLLVESGSCLGGMGTAAGVPMLCSMTNNVDFIAGGVGREVHDRLFALGGNSPICKPEENTIYFKPETLKVVYDQLINESSVKVLFLTSVVGLESEQGLVSHVVCNAKSGMFAVKANAYVDGTGDGDLCVWAGAPYQKGDGNGDMQPGSFVSYWSNIDWEKANAAGNGIWKQDGFLRKAIEDGVFTVEDRGMPGIIPTSAHSGNGNIGHLFGVDGTDEESMTKAAFWGRQMVYEYERYFKEYLKGYEDMELITTAAAIGIRETRRITGDYELCRKDYFDRAVFDDEIGRFWYGIDIHGTTAEESSDGSGDFHDSWLGSGESYGIPYRILTPQKVDNLLVAGRCVSCDRSVHGSIRVMPGCYITGQAAGVAAALCAQTGKPSREIGVEKVQQRLAKLGAYLPNFHSALV